MSFSFFFCIGTAITEIYTYLHTLSLHDALPIWPSKPRLTAYCQSGTGVYGRVTNSDKAISATNTARYTQTATFCILRSITAATITINLRSEEHTSELQSQMRLSYAVFRVKQKKR